MKRETDVYRPLIISMHNCDWLVYKIVDGSMGTKPGDFMGTTSDGRSVLIEAKRKTSPPEAMVDWSLFAPHQVSWLRGYAKRNAVALAVIYYSDTEEFGIWKLHNNKDFCARQPDLLTKINAGTNVDWSQFL